MLKTTEKLLKLPNSDKVEQLITALHIYIVEGNLRPGMEILSERELAEKLGVSRFSLREALSVAQAQGLIEIKRGCRPRVAKPTSKAASEAIALVLKRCGKKTFFDLTEARKSLECEIAGLAALRAKKHHLKKLHETIEQIEANPTDLSLCVEKDFEFHSILVDASENIIFKIMLEPLTELLRKSREETMRQNGVKRAIAGHTRILAAIIEKKPDKARKAMANHLRMAKNDLREAGSW
jgi:GntR family transcriptional repressor for pyruvate dehydrogenase complex